MTRFFLLAILFTGVLSCRKDESFDLETCNNFQTEEVTESRVTVTQGVYGVISFTQGDCMPGISIGACITCPVERMVRFYEYTTMSDVIADDNQGGFFTLFKTRLIAATTSDIYGFYELSLPPGTYSVVVVENGKLYANASDGQGGINPVTVGTGKLKVNFPITYKAAF